MSEKVVDIHQAPEKAEKKGKTVRPRVEAVLPSHIVEVWRLVERSIRDGGQSYPDTTEDAAETIRAHLFQYFQREHFAGLIARVGKRPVGVILGHIEMRAFGRPARYAFVHCIWVDPAYRKQAVGKLLWEQYTSRLKKAEIYHWEAKAHEHLVKQLTGDGPFPIQRLMSVIGGRL